MKKLIIALACATSLSAHAEKFFDEKKFEQDVTFYQQHSTDAQAILTLISATGIDRNMPIAFQNRANGDITKWKKLNSGLTAARDYANKISDFNYLSSCTNTVTYANLMWTSAVVGIDAEGWKDKFKEEQYTSAKKQFEENWLDCKSVARTPPKKENYYSDHEPIILGKEE